MISPKEKFMEEAIKEAKKAVKSGEYAIGAVVVKDDKIISRAFTSSRIERDPVLHAEILAIQRAARKLNSQYLEVCVLYTTHEPCPMCASAAVWAKMKGIVFGAYYSDAIKFVKKNSPDNFSWRQIEISCKDVLEKGEPKLELVEGFMNEECKKLFELNK